MFAVSTPLLFLRRFFRRVVAPGKPGAHALGICSEWSPVAYISRSNTHLQARLLCLVGYFVFRCSPNFVGGVLRFCERLAENSPELTQSLCRA